MSYVEKILAPDEKLIGIARLHWIYVLKGLVWFLVLAGAGWGFNILMTRGVLFLATAADSAMPVPLLSLGNGVMFFMMAGGFAVFFLFVLKVLVTEVALSTRRILHKEGLIFVKTKQIDLEEIRGENLDLGWLGRMLGYGYLMLDCRFIGDITLPAIENPERFLRALHDRRGKTQDSLSVVLGKGNQYPLKVAAEGEGPETPRPAPPEPVPPEVEPVQPDPAVPPKPEISPPTVPEIPTTVPNLPPVQPPQVPPANPTGQTVVVENAALDPKVVAEVVKQIMPQMAQQVANQLVEQGIVESHHVENDNQVDKDLIASFDEAALDSDGNPLGHKNKLEHAIH